MNRQLAAIAGAVAPPGELRDIAAQIIQLRGRREDLQAQRKRLDQTLASGAPLGSADDTTRIASLLRLADHDLGTIGAEIVALEAQERALKAEYGGALRVALSERRSDSWLDAERAAARFEGFAAAARQASTPGISGSTMNIRTAITSGFSPSRTTSTATGSKRGSRTACCISSCRKRKPQRREG